MAGFQGVGFSGHGGGGGGGYAQIVGKFTNQVELPSGNPHARMDLDVNGETYEGDINTHSNDGSNVEYYTRDTQVSSLPTPGVYTNSQFSYQGAGLNEGEFKSVDSDDFQNELEGWAKSSSEVALSGQTYANGPGKHGVHDIHMNSGESASSGHANSPNKDGYATFYLKNDDGTYDKKDVFTKFDTQALPGGSGGDSQSAPGGFNIAQ